MAQINDASDLISLLTDNGITGLDDYASKITGGSNGNPETIFVHKRISTTFNSALFWRSTWLWDSTPIGAGIQPTSFAICDNTTPGGLFQTNALTGNKRLLTVTAASSFCGVLVIYDRLAHCGGLDSNLTSVQNINGGLSGDVTRYTNGVGNKIWIENYFQGLETVQNIDIVATYTDGNGTVQTTPSNPFSGSTGVYAVNSQVIHEMSMAGNTVKGVTSIQVLNSTGTPSSIFGVTIAHPLYYVPVKLLSGGGAVGFLNAPVPVIRPGACLAMSWLPTYGGVPEGEYTIDVLATFVDNA